MTDKFQELAEHLWVTTHGNNFTKKMGEETIRFTLAQIHNAALEEAAMLMQDVSDNLPDGVHHAAMARADQIRKLKVKP